MAYHRLEIVSIWYTLYNTDNQQEKMPYTTSVVYEIPYSWDCVVVKKVVTLHRES